MGKDRNDIHCAINSDIYSDLSMQDLTVVIDEIV